MRRSQSKISIARSVLARHGVRGLLVSLARYFFLGGSSKKSCRLFLYVLDTPKATPESFKAAEGHTFRFATADDIEFYSKDPTWDIQDRAIAAFKRGNRCFLQFDGDSLVGYAWISGSQLVELMWGFHFNMPDDTVYNFKGYTAPAYRGKGFQPLRHLRLLEHIRREGKRRLLGYVDQMNLDSMSGLAKSGYKKVGTLRCIKKRGKVRFILNAPKDFWSEEKRT
jgi:GNAT superfamily N-acetyltransferase